jgi:PAS domain S-box-containing protein
MYEPMTSELSILNRTLSALSKSSQAMMRAEDESVYLEEVCTIVVQDCGYDMVWIGFAKDDDAKTIRPVAHAGFEEGYLDTLKLTWADTERGRGPTGTAIRTGKPSTCTNMLTDPNFTPWREAAIRRGYASSIVFPLMSAGKAFGAINIYSRDPDPFSPDDKRLLSELADDLSHGIMAIRLRAAHKKAEEAYRETSNYLQNLFDHANAPIIVWDPDFRITQFNRAFEHLTGHSAESVIGKRLDLLFPAGTLDLSMSRIEQTLSGEKWESVEIPILRRDGNVRIVLWNSANIYGSDGRTLVATIAQGQDISERKCMEEAVQKSRNELENRVRERTAELENVNRRILAEVAEREKTEHQLHSLTAILAKAEEQERRRIATDLHDRIIQTLVYANMKLSEFSESIQDTNACKTIDEISGYVQQTIRDLRTLTFELSPPVLYELGFVPAIRWLVHQFMEKHKLVIEFREEHVPGDLHKDVCIVIFQALRELLNNVVKHANARCVTLKMYGGSDVFKIVMEDDGIGFDPDQVHLNIDDNSGYGIFNIRERLGFLKGGMAIGSRPGGGTRIELTVPIGV